MTTTPSNLPGARGVFFCLALAACDDPGTSRTLVRDGAPLPTRWSELAAELTPETFSPRFPLWTDGLDKHRTISRPHPHAAPDEPGTIFTKTFSDGERPLETRVLVRREDGWELAAYLWERDGDDAVLLDGQQPTPVPDSSHVVPSQRQCRTCHESAPSHILGYNDVQLGHAPLIPGVADNDLPAAKRDAIGWVLGNCTHCHNGGDGPASVFDLRPAVFEAATLCVETTSSMSAPGLRIAPGDPDESVLYRAVSRDDGTAAMPPLGVHDPDPDGLAALHAYITSLTPNCQGASR